MKENKEMKIGMLLNYLSMILEGIIVFAFNPFIIRGLGQENYGVYSLMTSFTGYLSIFEFGLGTTIIRYISKYNEENKNEEKESFLSMIFGIYFFIAICIIVVCILLYYSLDSIFSSSLNFEQIILAKKLFVIIASSITLTTIGSVFSAIIQGYEKFIFSRLVVLITTFINVLLTVGVLIVYPTAELLSMITLIVSVLTIVINSIYVFKKLEVKVRMHKFDNQLFREIFQFSIFIFIQTLINQIYWRLDQLIIGITMANAAIPLAIYAVAMKINDIVLAFTTVINRYQLPTITRIVVNNDNGLTKYVANISRVVATLYFAVIIGFIFYGNRFISIYAGEGYEEAYPIVLIVIISASFSRIHGVGSDVLKAKNNHGMYTLIVFFSAIINVVLTIIFIKRYGLIGAAIATAISVILGNTVAYYWCLSKKGSLNIKELFKTTFKGFPLVCILTIIFNIFIINLGDNSLISYFSKCLSFAIFYIALVYLIILDENGKNQIKKKFKRR